MLQSAQRSVSRLVELGLPAAMAETAAAEIAQIMERIFADKKYFRNPVVLPGTKTLRRLGIMLADGAMPNNEDSKVVFLIACQSESEATQWGRQPLAGVDADVYAVIYGKADGLTQPANEKGFSLSSI